MFYYPSSIINKIFFSCYFLILFISNCILFYYDETGDKYHYYSIFFIGLILYFLYFLKLEKKKYPFIYKYLSSSTYIVLIGLFIVNFQTILNVILDYDSISFYLRTSRYDNVLGKVFCLSVIAMLSFFLGNKIKPLKTKKTYHKRIIVSPNLWVFITCILFGIFIYHIDLRSFISGETYIGSGGYDRVVNQSDIWENLFDAFNTISIAVYIFKANKDKNISIIRFIKSLPLILILINILYILLRSLSGDRGPVIYTLMMFFFAYIYVSKKEIKPILIVILISISAILVSLANVYRGMDTTLNISQKIQQTVGNSDERIVKKSFSPYTQELASSVNCNFIAVYDIENNKIDYKYGEYVLNRLIRIIPGINYISYFLTGEKVGGGSGEYITISYFGKHYRYGLGSTPIAEFFLDFGIIGVIIGFILMGIIYKNIDYKLMYENNLSILNLIFILKMTSMAIYISRSSLVFVLSKSIYVIFIYLLFNYIFQRFYIKK